MSVYSLKGFVAISSLVNNTPGQTSVIGEPSLWSMTYTKERGSYESSASPGFKLTSLSSIDSVAGKIAVVQPIADHALAVSAWVYNELLGAVLPIDKGDFIDALEAEFFEEAVEVTCGTFIEQGTVRMPEWISWKNQSNNDALIKVWFVDAAFKTQFDEFEIVVIPPLPNLDDFFLSPSVVQNKLNARTPKIVTTDIQAAKSENPETYIVTETFEYISPVDSTFKLNTNWNMLIYGQQGYNIDDIKNALVDYILDNSSHTIDEWTPVFPDIFKKTEFYLLPRWDKMAISDLTTQPGIFSPLVNLKEMTTFTKNRLSQLLATHVENNLFTFTHPYKSIAVACIAGPDNKTQAASIDLLFPDYINVGTLSQDFNRMVQDTRDWSNLLERLFIESEKITEFSSLPADMRRVKRNNIIYVGVVFNNIQYMMAPRSLYGVV